jgi:hypothetical protein
MDHDGSGANTVAPGGAGSDGRGLYGEAPERPIDLMLARTHLRLGSLALARAELEILGGRGVLDSPGHVDLAEARWRTGDLSGAGEAAAVAITAGEDAPVVLVIAAEAAAALGRPNEARRLATRAMEVVDGPIDNLFAGMPRSGVWPADASEPPPTAGTMFHHEPAPGPGRRAGDTNVDVAALRAQPTANRPSHAAPLTLGLWDPDSHDDGLTAQQPDPAGELDAARAALMAGALDDASLRFGLALRLAPALAPAVLEATEGVSTPAINVVRGDAYRLVGLETEARRAYGAAAWSGSRDRRGRSVAAAQPVAGEEARPEAERPPVEDLPEAADAQAPSPDA